MKTVIRETPAASAVRRLVHDTPALSDSTHDREPPAAALDPDHSHRPDVFARVAAAPLTGVREELIAENTRRLLRPAAVPLLRPEPYPPR
ncbi:MULTISPECIES: hypothetical protein [unclassified Streptomyces]|uniref:hypothetical protein n=1 Tax=unclassified Streptomyces TaxID=2593676 RepID=UPI002E1F7EDC|nr:hypothetical protein OG217_13040 [Streptomyces sp. NBC_01023]